MKIMVLTFCMAFFIGCTPFQPALSLTDTSKVESHPVKGRQGILINQKLSFGGYQTSKVKRSWTKGGNSRVSFSSGTVTDILYPNLISMGYSSRHQSFNFVMNDSVGNRSDVYAVSDFEGEDLQIGDNPNSIGNIIEDIFGNNDYSQNLFYVQIFLNHDTTPWQLVLDNDAAQLNAKSYTGAFAYDNDTFYTIRPITKIAGKNGPASIAMGSIGFEIINAKQDFVAAVSLIDNGAVYFNTSDPNERFILANLCAALLLQENIAE